METEAIQDRPRYPPVPVGVSIQHDGGEPRYYAWGHPAENNCTKGEAREALRQAYESGEDLLFHNSKFDLEVAAAHLDLPIPPWQRCHDTLYLLFLCDPYAPTLSLKPSAERLLGMPPEEQSAVFEWLEAHGFISSTTRKGKRVWQKDAGAYICHAPGNLVGEYAKGDVVRTYRLFQKLYPTLDEGMRQAYDRERRLMPVLLANEQRGMRVDLPRLLEEIPKYQAAKEKCDAWIRERLGNSSLNLDSDADLAKQLELMGEVTEWTKTPTGKNSVSKKNLTPDKFRTPELAQALGYRNRLETVMANSMLPWAEAAQANGGYITTSWNQVRGDDSGARTGRLSCSRFMNISKRWGDGYKHPVFLGVPELPLVREIILPDEGGVFAHRDYKQQEFRMAAHFEDGVLCAEYNADPDLDIHVHTQHIIQDLLGREVDRNGVKAVGFGRIYGMGRKTLAERLHITEAEADVLIRAHKAALPGITQLEREIKQRARDGGKVRTWGGRLYGVEPAKEIDGVWRTFEYKMLNHLIQGSSADVTKEALLRYDAARKHGRLLVTVHDEINISVPQEHVDTEMKILRDCMASVEVDVPMLSDGKVGPCWGRLEKYADKE